ncbi:A/G-specific adenine glycosylase [Levilactobacillus bambusae]|uniref:Adenine DNA glycosylase n=1 Tax=Levilactobacillus bambusae TaxID=2024736 RepID=A0A2V1N171_9LACO|nr:A/G-specific adenine glycosylase [Levilactobacillus bambusae]PWG00135.1 A/G-specific adenine glycosylase [Levilactobacillus bambusae]
MTVTWSNQQIKEFRKTLLDWYDEERRDLPWRQDHDPYHVWISEIMLQQTQVNTVIPYYTRFMKLFPTVSDLANADEAVLLKAWEGLGYYSRAKNLKRAAQQIMADYQGVFPETPEALEDLAGIGPYTAGAIASIAFNVPVPAVDGNAFRVFSRLMEIEADIAKPQTRKIFTDIIAKVIDPDRPGDFNQAIMDLGSSYMTAKNPDPEHSPVKAFDQAYLDGKELDFPVKSKKPKPVDVPYVGLIIRSERGYLMQHRGTTGMLAGFWTFPLIKIADLDLGDDVVMATELAQHVTEYLHRETGITAELTPMGGRAITQVYTHQKWQVNLFGAEVLAQDLSHFPGEWVPQSNLAKLALPKVQIKMMNRLGMDPTK